MKILSLSPPFLPLVLLGWIICQASAFHGVSLLQLPAISHQQNSTRWSKLKASSLGHANKGSAVSSKPLRVASKEDDDSPKKWRFRKTRGLFVALMPILTVLLVSRPAAHAASSAAVLPERLRLQNLAFSTMVLVSVGALPLSYNGAAPLAKSLLVSASRCAIQVSLLGSIVLQRMMGVKSPWIVATWILGVGIIAGRETVSRIKYSYPNRSRNTYGSVLASGLVVLGLTLALNLFGRLTPWFDPRTWIPIAGMLFGNTLNACALGASSISSQFAKRSDEVELRWMRGATNQEAARPLLEESLTLSLMPTFNGLAASGIIHIPGMMSGQILAGQSPQQASLYQIVINFLIASTALLSVQLVIHSSFGSIVDKANSRLRCGVLELNKSPEAGSSESKQQKNDSVSSQSQDKQLPTLSCQKLSWKKGTSVNVSASVLEVKGLEVPRANAKIKMVLRGGDRIAISGKSGTGKTQILRTILGLEDSPIDHQSSISLFGNSFDPSELPGFRSRVCLVPSNKPTLEGTPNQFYKEILRFKSQKADNDQMKNDLITPSDIAQNWNLEPSALDRDWRTLSGGESQRAALAIALALKPDVLLLDESTSLLDEGTSKLVEKTLKESNIPMIVVTHSEDQLKRFCTHKLVL